MIVGINGIVLWDDLDGVTNVGVPPYDDNILPDGMSA